MTSSLVGSEMCIRDRMRSVLSSGGWWWCLLLLRCGASLRASLRFHLRHHCCQLRPGARPLLPSSPVAPMAV
eukprot:12644615-Prorocentrum_lima.AAC.1